MIMINTGLRSQKNCMFFIFALTTMTNFPRTVGEEDPIDKRQSNIQKLKDKLMHDYDVSVRPVEHHSNTTTVWFNLIPLYIVTLEERLSLLHVDSWFYMKWRDYRLSWNASDYDGITELHLADREVWQPDIIVFNGHSGIVNPKQNAPLTVTSDGYVLFFPPAVLITRCPINLKGSYPKDTILCQIELGSWTHDGWQVNFQIADERIYMHQFTNTNPRWELIVDEVNMTRDVKFYDCCAEPYITIRANLPMRRRPPPEFQVIWAPCVMMMALTLTMFWIPANSSKKILLGGFLFSALCLLIIYVAIVTKSPTSVKKAVTFLESALYIVSLATLLEVVVISLSSVTGPCRPPDVLVQILTGSFGKYVGIWQSWRTNGAGDMMQLKEEDYQIKSHHPTAKEEWLLVATGLDRLLFLLFIIIVAAIHQL